jgi:hypothetical protein
LEYGSRPFHHFGKNNYRFSVSGIFAITSCARATARNGRTSVRVRYDFGRDMLSALGIILNFSREMIIWEEGKMPMKPQDSTLENSFFVKEPDALHEEADKMSKT